MSSAETSINGLIHAAKTLRANEYLAVLSSTVLIYDYFQTLEQEVAFVWKAKWNLGTIVYLLTKYPTFAYISVYIYYITASKVSPKTCHKLFSFTVLIGAFIIAAAEVILIMRTFALSESNKWLLGILLSIYITGTISEFVILGKSVIPLEYKALPMPTLRQCSPITASPLGITSFGLLLAFEVLIFVITLAIGVQRFRRTRSPLVVSLYTDGIFYFINIVLVSLANIIVQSVGPYQLIQSLSVLQTVMHSVLACRILLHVRRHVSSSYCAWEYDPDTRVSSIQFTATDLTREQAMQTVT